MTNFLFFLLFIITVSCIIIYFIEFLLMINDHLLMKVMSKDGINEGSILKSNREQSGLRATAAADLFIYNF